ncbi:MurR/RpiR family transcriptional regulator [Spiribacter sp. 2438]|uniref:MurR/RpiR family transcriptional regulator n=1 Tax=Spiribacter sp. 2438 TaxID=2666185 RepID=UPI001E4A0D89|nr:MurR/RpiR family transcriptional regulator [Spiribacter sp. 2438]
MTPMPVTESSTALLTRIEQIRPSLPPSEQKVADRILAQPHTVIDQSVARLSAQSGVSEPTVVRFCQRLGHKGIQAFKLALARSLATDHRPTGPLGDTGDEPLEALAAKVMDRQIAALIQTRNHLDHNTLEHAIDWLAQASRIELYGHGASGAVAEDARHKFFRLGMPVAAYTDPHNHAISATVIPPDAVIIAISHTGRSQDLLSSVATATRRGVPVIAITAPGTPLAAQARLCLHADVNEDIDIYAPMLSRLAHLALLDVLAVGVALRGGAATRRQLAQIKASLDSHRQTGNPSD